MDIEDYLGKIDIYIDKTKEDKTTLFASIIVIILAVILTPKLSPKILQYFRYWWFKLILFIIAIYISRRNIVLGLAIIIGVFVILLMLERHISYANIEVVKTQSLPSPSTIPIRSFVPVIHTQEVSTNGGRHLVSTPLIPNYGDTTLLRDPIPTDVVPNVIHEIKEIDLPTDGRQPGIPDRNKYINQANVESNKPCGCSSYGSVCSCRYNPQMQTDIGNTVFEENKLEPPMGLTNNGFDPLETNFEALR
jgi:hypothetical protein